MGWLWETERDERRRSSGLRFVLLGGLAPLVVIGAVAGVMLAGPGASGRAGVAAEAQTLDCALPRNACARRARPRQRPDRPRRHPR